jgi:uncharacterized membrane protein YgcG
VPLARVAPPLGVWATTRPRFLGIAWILVILPMAQWRARILAFALVSFSPITPGTMHFTGGGGGAGGGGGGGGGGVPTWIVLTMPNPWW